MTRVQEIWLNNNFLPISYKGFCPIIYWVGIKFRSCNGLHWALRNVITDNIITFKEDGTPCYNLLIVISLASCDHIKQRQHLLYSTWSQSQTDKASWAYTLLLISIGVIQDFVKMITYVNWAIKLPVITLDGFRYIYNHTLLLIRS
jgi:hypothetical protein